MYALHGTHPFNLRLGSIKGGSGVALLLILDTIVTLTWSGNFGVT